MPITERTLTVPVSPYGKAKLTAENHLRELASKHKDFHVIMLRYFNVIGADPRGRLGENPRHRF